jgi:hypothetical protein
MGENIAGKMNWNKTIEDKWLRSLISNHLPLTAVGSNPDRDFVLFHVRKLSS